MGDAFEVAVTIFEVEGRTGDDVPHDVTTGPKGREKLAIERSRQVAQFPFHHAMKLDRLARREAKGPIGDGCGDIVHAQPLVRRQPAARDDHANHEDVIESLTGQRARSSFVTIVLRVDAMKLEELFAIA